MPSILNKLSCLLIASIGAVSVPAHADLSIFPIKLFITGDNGQRTTTMNVISSNEEPLQSYEINVFRWTQDDQGHEVLTPDTELMVNPLSFMLEPNSKRIIRMGFKQPIASMQLQEEAAWRIIFTPLPDAKKAKGLKYAYSFNVPLFAGKDFKPEMSFQLAKNNKNQPVLLAKNSGTAHFQITGLKLQDTAGKDIFNSKELKYVLPRKQVSFDLNTLAVKPDAGLKLTVQTAGSETLQFDVAE